MTKTQPKTEAGKRVVIFGTSKLAQLVHFYLTQDSPHQAAAFTVDQAYLDKKEMMGLPVVAFEEVEKTFPPDSYAMFVALGYTKLNSLRAAKYGEAKAKGYQLISYVSSKASWWGETRIGDNCLILENQVIQPFVSLGNDVIIWSGNHFGHDVVIGDHVWISSQVVVSGGVVIEPYTFVGVNATIRDQVRVARENIIGAGALILNDTKPRQVFVAQPTEVYPLDSARFERMMDISG
ncbi:MAG: acetyltransferase [Deltaproteobacteria bacterium]|nr:acetyltransferase [Deltaproteobacteria bacterium]